MTLKMAELNPSTEETNTKLMHRRKAKLNNVGGAEGEMQKMPGMQRGKAKLLMSEMR